MDNPISNNDLTAVISFEDSVEKLHSCLESLRTWIPRITVVLREDENSAKEIIDKFNASVYIHSASTTFDRWECGLTQTKTSWVLLIRSNEVVTGQLRKTIVERTKTNGDDSCEYALPTTIIFLKKRLKYSLDWHDSYPSLLAYLPKNVSTIQELKKGKASFDGELIRYHEDTLSDCAKKVIKKGDERAGNLAKISTNSNVYSLFLAGCFSSIKIFLRAYLLRKGFKEGFEGIAFSVCDAHAELLGYLSYYEIYIRKKKNLQDDPSGLRKILIIKLRDIGDNILCTPLIHNLKNHLPKSSVSVLTWSYSEPVFENNPHIDQLFTLSKETSRKDIKKLLNQLNYFNFDLVISTHSGGLASKLLLKIKTKYRINNYYRGRNKSYNLITQESDYYRSSIERDLDCLRSLGINPTDKKTQLFLSNDEIFSAKNDLIAKGINFDKKKVLVHPTAAVSIREWPLTKFNQLIQKLKKNENIQPIVICTEPEHSRVKSLLDDIPDLIIFHQMTVRQMIAIIHQCDLVIDNDSSPSHIATAFKIPTIVLFSQAIREIFRPYNYETDRHFVFYKDVDCRECGLSYCPDRICLDFSPSEVFSQALEMLSLNNH